MSTKKRAETDAAAEQAIPAPGLPAPAAGEGEGRAAGELGVWESDRLVVVAASEDQGE